MGQISRSTAQGANGSPTERVHDLHWREHVTVYIFYSAGFRIIVTLVVVIGAVVGVYWKGRIDANAQWKARMAEMEAASQKKLVEATDEVRRVETEAAQRLHEVAARYGQEVKHAKTETDRLLSSLRTGGIRLSVPTANSCRYAEAINPTFATGSRTEARSELATEAAATLIAIASEGDEAIRQLNACIDAYNGLRSKLNNE